MTISCTSRSPIQEYVGVGWRQGKERTGQVPPETTRSKDKASGIPSVEVLLLELIESLIDWVFFDPMEERRLEDTRDGRRYNNE